MIRALLAYFFMTISLPAWSQWIMVPPGNLNGTQPSLPNSTIERLQKDTHVGWGQTISVAEVVERRYQDARRMITADIGHSNFPILSEIKHAAGIYQIDPIHVLGAIVGEHTYNVGGVDQVQDFIGLVASWAPDWAVRFNSNAISLEELLKRPDFLACRPATDYDYWFCVQETWQRSYRGRRIDGHDMPNSSLRMTFFNPFFAGHTYGLGQLDPLRALMVSDLVSTYSGFAPLSITNVGQIYGAIVHPHTNVHYVAANIRMMIETYRNIAGFDISLNPGITATLYNLGNEKSRAHNLKKANQNGQTVWPEENYYGWFVNTREADLRTVLEMVP